MPCFEEIFFSNLVEFFAYVNFRMAESLRSEVRVAICSMVQSQITIVKNLAILFAGSKQHSTILGERDRHVYIFGISVPI